MVEGSITIEALLGTNKFDKQIRQLEKHIEKKESQSIEIDAEIKNIREQVDDFNELIKQADLYKKVVEQINERNTQINKERLSKGLGLVDLTDKAKQIIAESSRLEEYIQNNASAMQKLADKGNELLKKQKQINNEVTEYKQKIETIQVEKLKKGLDGVGNSLESSIKKVAKLALGIFGLRSAYMALRRASSDLASYDQQYAANLEYIRYALTQAIAPVLRYIVNLAATLLQYINMILNALFGINIFSRGSAESFNKMKAGASGVSKAVKEIKKQLAGFDEINMLTDQSDTGTAGGAGGVGIPSFDLSALNAKPPKWLQWIIDNKDKVLSILTAIGGGLAFLKLATIAKNLGLIKGKLLALKALGIAVAIYGVIEAVKGLIAFIKDPTWENFKKFLYGLATAIAGVAIAMIAFNATNPVAWILLAIGVVVALATKIADLTQKYITNKKGTLDLKNAKEALKKSEEALTEATDEYINAVDNANEAQRKLIEAEKRNKMSGKELYEQVKNGTLNYRDMTEAQKEVYKAYVNNEKAQKNLEEATKEYTQAQKEHEKQSYNNQLALLLEAKKYDELKSSVIQAYKEGKISAGEARDYIEQAMKDMDETSAQTFLQDIPNNIKEGINPDKYKGNWYNFKKKWNEFIDGLKKKIEVKFEGIFKSNVEGFSGGSHGFAKGGIVYHNLPKLGVGGIINQPGRGVPLNGAIVGERGAEGVIPLTDSQQMELLGQTIGKYIVVNANIVNTMNGRVISRELKQVQSEQAFAYNT